MRLNILLIFYINYFVLCYKSNLRKYYYFCDKIDCNSENKIFNDCINLCSNNGNKVFCFDDCLFEKQNMYKKCCNK